MIIYFYFNIIIMFAKYISSFLCILNVYFLKTVLICKENTPNYIKNKLIVVNTYKNNLYYDKINPYLIKINAKYIRYKTKFNIIKENLQNITIPRRM